MLPTHLFSPLRTWNAHNANARFICPRSSDMSFFNVMVFVQSIFWTFPDIPGGWFEKRVVPLPKGNITDVSHLPRQDASQMPPPPSPPHRLALYVKPKLKQPDGEACRNCCGTAGRERGGRNRWGRASWVVVMRWGPSLMLYSVSGLTSTIPAAPAGDTSLTPPEGQSTWQGHSLDDLSREQCLVR